MSLDVAPEHVPLVVDRDGSVRVDRTRVTLAAVVSTFRAGATAEQITQKFPSVPLADVYAVLTYYLRHRAVVDEHLRARAEESDRVREANEIRFAPDGIRDRLLARRTG